MRCPRLRLLVPVLVLLSAAACSGGSGGASQGDRLHPKGGDVFLEALAESGPNTFTHSVALAPVPSIGVAGTTGGSSTQGLRSIAGTTAGLYGGSGSQQACDPNAAVASLL
ncbi:MAG TPA: hypothetical protein VHD87_06425, partial [Acidimicrobiales bacterium]|nr:hypothetical protein [Acidimicrobiales bacterium]